jgi:hypothetical protein
VKATFATCVAACALLAGCALIQPPPPKPAQPQPSPRELLGSLTIGESTKADVRAALGEAVVVDFPTGYEVWVYKDESAPASAELVLLFAPSGILTKTRVR